MPKKPNKIHNPPDPATLNYHETPPGPPKHRRLNWDALISAIRDDQWLELDTQTFNSLTGSKSSYLISTYGCLSYAIHGPRGALRECGFEASIRMALGKIFIRRRTTTPPTPSQMPSAAPQTSPEARSPSETEKDTIQAIPSPGAHSVPNLPGQP